MIFGSYPDIAPLLNYDTAQLDVNNDRRVIEGTNGVLIGQLTVDSEVLAEPETEILGYCPAYVLEELETTHNEPGDSRSIHLKGLIDKVYNISAARKHAEHSKVLGFGYIDGQVGDGYKGAAVIPSPKLINRRLELIHEPTGKAPPFTFEPYSSRQGTLSIQVLTIYVARRAIPYPIPSSEGQGTKEEDSAFSHFVSDLLIGATRINHEAAEMFQRSAQRIIAQQMIRRELRTKPENEDELIAEINVDANLSNFRYDFTRFLKTLGNLGVSEMRSSKSKSRGLPGKGLRAISNHRFCYPELLLTATDYFTEDEKDYALRTIVSEASKHQKRLQKRSKQIRQAALF
jgi:hypothetical protein